MPALLRDLATDVLQFNQTMVDQVAPVMGKVTDALQRSGAQQIIDLCSGGSGPLLKLVEHLEEDGRAVPVLMTDKFPNRGAFETIKERSGGRIDFSSEPVDATAVPSALVGLRTLFNGFHHFRPAVARKILEDAVNDRQPIAVFEFIHRSPIAMLGIVMAAFIILPLAIPEAGLAPLAR